MPVIEVYSPTAGPGRERLAAVSLAVTTCLGIDPGFCWVLWNHLGPDASFRPEWDGGRPAAPVALVTCKETFSREQASRLVGTIARELAAATGTPEAEVYVALRRVAAGDLWVRGAVWPTS